MNELENYVGRVITEVRATSTAYARFERPGIATFPIPFFGDVQGAKVLTVGVNPSANEFVGRNWPAKMSTEELTHRLTTYFVSRQGSVGPHPWFGTWNQALAHLGLSYENGCAHVDLSPRATIAMRSIVDSRGFLEMVETDVKWFFELLPLCHDAKAVLMGGCVTKRSYIDRFIARNAPRFGWRLSGEIEGQGKGRVGMLRLNGHGRDVPVFFCSVSPSAGSARHVLVERVHAHAPAIRDWVRIQPTSPEGLGAVN